MLRRWPALFAIVPFLAVSAATDAQAPLKNIELTHAFDLAARKFGENDITPTTQRFGVEAVRDLNTGKGLYVTEKGAIALCPGFDAPKPGGNAKGAVWITGLDLPARKAGEKNKGSVPARLDLGYSPSLAQRLATYWPVELTEN